MAAVAPPVQLQQTRLSWSSANGPGSSQNGGDDSNRMTAMGPRKAAQRTNSSSSLNSNSSSNSSISTISNGSHGTITGADVAEVRKKPNRGVWPTGKSQPVSGISVARPQSISTASGGQSAASGLSALHGPIQSGPQSTNGVGQSPPPRGNSASEPSTFLYLIPMNGTFERKTISVPYFPDTIRIGRQTNSKTAPTQLNGFFDSKVLSRQHAEVYAERSGRIFIRDVKSSNGTFVNGKRLSPENKESEPHELREADVLELGIDIVSDDQKTVVHHKVAARVEHAGIYPQPGDVPFVDHENGGQYNNVNGQRARPQTHAGLPGLKTGGVAGVPPQAHRDAAIMQQQPWNRLWLQPISTEHIVKRLNRELALARQQSQDIDRARQHLGKVVNASFTTARDSIAAGSRHVSRSPPNSTSRSFPEPPAPPPSQPLPEKPELERGIEEHLIQPLLLRSETARPGSLDLKTAEPGRALSNLLAELKATKDQLPSLQDRVRLLEQQLDEERTARVNAEERASQLEYASRKDSAEPTADESEKPTERDGSSTTSGDHNLSTLQTRLEQLQMNMSDMQTQMESYRKRAEAAEVERDEARQSLADLIAERRRTFDTALQDTGSFGLKLSKSRSREVKPDPDDVNAQTIRPNSSHRNIAVTSLLERAGVEPGKHMTKKQAIDLLQVLRTEQLVDDRGLVNGMSYNGLPAACALTTLVFGIMVMGWLNGWEKR